MILTNTQWNTLATAIANMELFNPEAGSENKIALFINNVNIGPGTLLDDLELATFTGSTPKACGAGAAEVATNPITGELQIRPKEPAGGFQFVATNGDNLPQTVYGFALLTNDLGDYIAGQNFTTPIPITASNQVVDVPQPTLVLAIPPLT